MDWRKTKNWKKYYRMSQDIRKKVYMAKTREPPRKFFLSNTFQGELAYWTFHIIAFQVCLPNNPSVNI